MNEREWVVLGIRTVGRPRPASRLRSDLWRAQRKFCAAFVPIRIHQKRVQPTQLPAAYLLLRCDPMSQVSNASPSASTITAARPVCASRAGLAYGLSAYIIWGFIPIYFHILSNVAPVRVLYHRIIWSALFMGLIVSVRGEWSSIRPVISSRRNLAMLSAGALLIAINWLVFIYSVATGQLLQASLGYFINPLLSVALGLIFLREQLRGWQWLAVLLAIAAVLNLALRGGGFPWLAVALAGSFGFYGLVRKTIDINSLHALMVESAILFPIAVLVLAFWRSDPLPWQTVGILSLSGIITAVPLLCFGAALRRLRLSTMGFLQYVGPTLQFLVAVCLFGEPLSRDKLASFALCWIAIGVYIADSLIHQRFQAVADEPD